MTSGLGSSKDELQQRLLPGSSTFTAGVGNAILAPSDYDVQDSDVIVGTPILSQTAATAVEDQIRIIGDGCYYNFKYIAPAHLCLSLTYFPQTLQQQVPSRAKPTKQPSYAGKTSTPEPNEESVTDKLSSSVWATLKSVPLLGQLLKDI